MPTREEVYYAIDSERDYQQSRAVAAGTDSEAVRPHSMEEFIIYMDDYMLECKHYLSREWTADRKPTENALNTFRKVVAMGVACMEQNGAPLRPGIFIAADGSVMGSTGATAKELTR